METEWTSEWKPSSQDLPKLGPETLAAVHALQGGEVQESTRHLFETFEPELGAYFRRHGCQDHEADDLTQSVFIRMLEQIGTLKDATSFRFWLFKIAGNYLRNFLRDRVRSREGVEELADKARKDSESSAFWVRGTFEPSPEAKLTVSETVDRRRVILRTLLKVTRLASRTRQSLLRRLQGDSYEEIARALDIRVGTVGSHISRASAALLRNLGKIDLAGIAVEDDVTREDGGDDLVADLSSELLTFKQEALEADPAYFRAGVLEAASAHHEEAEESDEEALMLLAEEEHEDDEAEMERVERVVDSPAEIAAVRRQDRARGRSRRRVTRTILPAGRHAKEPVLGRLDKDDLSYPAILLGEAVSFLGNGLNGDLALKAKLTCAGSLLARGRRFKTARLVEEIVRQAIVLIGNGRGDGNGRWDDIRRKVAEGRTLLRSFLSNPPAHESSRRLEPCQ